MEVTHLRLLWALTAPQTFPVFDGLTTLRRTGQGFLECPSLGVCLFFS